MELLDKLLEISYKNNKTINIKDILELKLPEEEFEVLINKLIECGINIDDEYIEENDKEDVFFSNGVKQYFSEIRKIPLLTESEEKKMFEKYWENRDLKKRNDIVDHNLRLVVNIAKRYRYRLATSSIDLLDIIQAGNEGLIRAVEKYNPEFENKLSTYAIWWIRQSIEKYLDDTIQAIRVPSNLTYVYNRYYRYKKNVIENNGVLPSNKEIAEYLGVSLKRLENAITAKERDFLSVDEYLYDEKNHTRGDFLHEHEKTLETRIYEKVQSEEIVAIMRKILKPEEFYVLSYRIGIITEFNEFGEEKTLSAIGKEFGITRERVRQIEQSTLTKIKEIVKWREKINDLIISKKK